MRPGNKRDTDCFVLSVGKNAKSDFSIDFSTYSSNTQLHDKTFIGLGNGGYRFIQSR